MSIKNIKNILFPSDDETLDFAGGTALGWIEVSGNKTLRDFADKIAVAPEEGPSPSHAIPSPIAHVKDFKTRLDNDDEDALNEWRGMLAVIALREARGYAVSIRDISLSKTDLGRVFFDALKDNSNVTGYTDGENVTGYKDNNENRHDPVLTVFSMRDRNGNDREYILNFLIFMTCEYCGKHFFTSKISLFGDYLVCLCPRCGGRHAITINMVGSYRRIKLLTVAALITVLISPLICRLIFVLYYMWIGQ